MPLFRCFLLCFFLSAMGADEKIIHISLKTERCSGRRALGVWDTDQSRKVSKGGGQPALFFLARLHLVGGGDADFCAASDTGLRDGRGVRSIQKWSITM